MININLSKLHTYACLCGNCSGWIVTYILPQKERKKMTKKDKLIFCRERVTAGLSL